MNGHNIVGAILSSGSTWNRMSVILNFQYVYHKRVILLLSNIGVTHRKMSSTMATSSISSFVNVTLSSSYSTTDVKLFVLSILSTFRSVDVVALLMVSNSTWFY
jgi:hypothetical protein